MADSYIRAGFYQAGSGDVCVAKLDSTLFTHLIYVPSSPLRILKLKFCLHEDDLRHVTTLTHHVTCKALLALPYSFYARPRPNQTQVSTTEIAREHQFHGVHFTLVAFDAPFLDFCEDWRAAAAQETTLTSPVHTVLYDPTPRPTCQYTPLYGDEPSDTRAIHAKLRTCLDAGVDPSILVLGLARHGFCFQLKDPSVHGMGAPVDETPCAWLIGHGCHPRGKHAECCNVTRQRLPPHIDPQKGSVAYRDVKEFIKERKAKYCYDSTTESAYCHHGTTWICYDNTLTISQKVAYLKNMSLKGYALDSLHEDTSDWDLSNAARRSLLIVAEDKQTRSNWKAKEDKGKQKKQSRSRREIIAHGVDIFAQKEKV
ncbi:hypothetical protein GOP47_0009604 [Adiantum capillus-veneris]|uniref:Chitinase II/V-like catalytic domain-containing protein n=1 Tax=Adiantum capillus-veneris TaxID=13818 RepID=A0A9D4UXT2_ADICA|nr:hypothetical protein GOP47_0009604 [Adiantum capillus-veneris]